MTDEEGLQGCWFTGAITKLQHGYARIQYEELMDEDDTNQHLEEWFPLPEAVEADAARLGSEHDAHFGPGYQIRPVPPIQVLLHARCQLHVTLLPPIQPIPNVVHADDCKV